MGISYYTKYSRYNLVTLSDTSWYQSLPASRSCCTIIARNFPARGYQIETQWLSILILYVHVLLRLCFVKACLFAHNSLLCISPSAISHFSHSWPFAPHSYSFGYLHVGAGDSCARLYFFQGLLTHIPWHLHHRFKGKNYIVTKQSTLRFTCKRFVCLFFWYSFWKICFSHWVNKMWGKLWYNSCNI